MVNVIIYLLLYNLHDCTFKSKILKIVHAREATIECSILGGF